MLSENCRNELQRSWLPNVTNEGLDRLIDMLDKSSPLLIHGCFTRSVPMGCLASHIAWNHPQTCRLTQDAGICWLHQVAGLNPATSHVIREWDQSNPFDWETRRELLAIFAEERKARTERTMTRARRLSEFVEA